MSRFCVKRGQAAGDGGFCTGCGFRLESNNSTGPSSSQPTPANNAPGASSTVPARVGMLKVILIAVGGIVVIGSVAVGGLVYAGYRATAKAKQVNEEYGLDSILKQVKSAAKNENKTSSQGGTATSSQRDACSFMTKEEVGAATGTAFSSASLSDDKDVCTYEPADDDSVIVVVDVKRSGGALAMKVLPKFSEELGEGDIRRPIKGIGNEAFLLGADEKTQKGLDDASPDLKALTNFATGPLVFRKGDVWVAVTATLSDNKGEVEKKIASILATRI